VSGIAAQLILTIFFFPELLWIKSASNSLPTPVSPQIIIGVSYLAKLAALTSKFFIVELFDKVIGLEKSTELSDAIKSQLILVAE